MKGIHKHTHRLCLCLCLSLTRTHTHTHTHRGMDACTNTRTHTHTKTIKCTQALNNIVPHTGKFQCNCIRSYFSRPHSDSSIFGSELSASDMAACSWWFSVTQSELLTVQQFVVNHNGSTPFVLILCFLKGQVQGWGWFLTRFPLKFAENNDVGEIVIWGL